MNTRLLKKTGGFLLTVLASTILVVLIHLLTSGMYLLGVPKAQEVQAVTLSYPQVSEAVKEVNDREKIEQAVKLTGFLKYSLFQEADTGGEPLITMTYRLADGRTVSVSANRETVWWKGKARALKKPDMFLNLAQGIFFLEDLAQE